MSCLHVINAALQPPSWHRVGVPRLFNISASANVTLANTSFVTACSTVVEYQRFLCNSSTNVYGVVQVRWGWSAAGRGRWPAPANAAFTRIARLRRSALTG